LFRQISMDYTQFFRFVKFQGKTNGRIAVRPAGACAGTEDAGSVADYGGLDTGRLTIGA